MPPKYKFSKEEIVQAALNLTREEGFGAVTARAVAAKLQSSPKVIFGLFQNMEALQREVLKEANAIYQQYLKTEMESGKYPPYKASGMAYIRLAKEEKELFKLLFMRDRSEEVIPKDREAQELEPIIAIIRKNTGLNQEEAGLFHLEMWVYVHGIATMLATSYLELDWELISKMLTDCYEGMQYGCHKHK